MKRFMGLVIALMGFILVISLVGLADEERDRFEVVVIGGGPEGVAAAVAAARNGAHVLLIESRPKLGGVLTLAKLNSFDMNYGPENQLLTQGLFAWLFERLERRTSFDVTEAEAALLELVSKQPNLTLMLGTEVVAPILSEDGHLLRGVLILRERGMVTVYADRFIDATEDADLAAISGVPYTVGREEICEISVLSCQPMAPTLVFQVGGVDWEAIQMYLNNDKNPVTGADATSAWGYGQFINDYRPGDPLMRLRGLNIGRQRDGSVLINALLIFDVDVLDPTSRQKAMVRGQQEVERIIVYLREHAPGFENAYLIGVADELYVRESRHILGEYQLTVNDVLENRDFWDRIAIGSYPIDTHPAIPEERGFVIGTPAQYSVPFRSLVPLRVDNLLVVGRSASYTALAAGSVRVVPVGMTEGEAAGVAAAYSVQHGMNFRKLAQDQEEIRQIQALLIAQGAYLEPFQISAPYADHWTYPCIRRLRKRGSIVGGYNNNLRLETEMPPRYLLNLLNNALRPLPPGIKSVYDLALFVDQEAISQEEAIAFLEKLASIYGVNADGLISGELRERLDRHEGIRREEGIAMVCALADRIVEGDRSESAEK
ncbi:MAG: FAD-dependent oxidoreductase [Candidatus Bipolaricaulia bacterium]